MTHLGLQAHRNRSRFLKQILGKIFVLSFILIWLHPSLFQLGDQAKLPLLNQARDVRHLSPIQSKQGYPVHLKAVVTYCDPDWNVLFVQDSNFGIYVSVKSWDIPIEPGMLVEVEGVSASGDFLPIVAQAKIKPLYKAPFPTPRAVSINKLQALRDDCQWVELEGVIHHAGQEGHVSVLSLVENETQISVRVLNSLNFPPGGLIDAKVRIRGVIATLMNPADKTTHLEFWSPLGSQVDILIPPPGGLFSIPFSTVAVLRQFEHNKLPEHRVRMEGIFLPGSAQEYFLLKDPTGSISIEASEKVLCEPGDPIQVIGFPARRGNLLVLENAFHLNHNSNKYSSRQEKGLPLLTQVRQVRSLDEKEAERGYPLRINGILTLYESKYNFAFLQDETGGIFINLGNLSIHPIPGQKYRIEGFSAPGEYAPVITKPQFTHIGSAPMPPAVRVNLNELATGKYDSMRVMVEGIVRFISQEPDPVTLEIASEGKRIRVVYPGAISGKSFGRMEDARIRVQGVCAMDLNSQGKMRSFLVILSSDKDVQILEPQLADPFSLPRRLISDLQRYSPQEQTNHRILIRGAVMHQEPGEALYLKDETGCICIRTRQSNFVQPGDVLSVLGYPSPGEFAPILEDAVFKWKENGLPAAPVKVSANELLQGLHQGNLVRLRAKLLDQSEKRGVRSFLLQDSQEGQILFDAWMKESAMKTAPPEIPTGSEIELTGICLMRREGRQSAAFQILLPDSGDIRILKRPPWWNSQFAFWAAGILLAVVVGVSLWMGQLRRRVKSQTELIRQQLEHEHSLEKKYRDLFERSHDIVFSCAMDRKIQSINPAAERISGYSRDELLQLDFKDLVDRKSVV
jgi:PAS domain-containing protein